MLGFHYAYIKKRTAMKLSTIPTVFLLASGLLIPSIAPADKPNNRRRFEDCGEEHLDRVMVRSHRDQLDPATVFEAQSDGEYLLGVENSRGQAGEASGQSTVGIIRG